jgi:general secretion pathway protein A
LAYNQFYGFKENPFNQTPDSSFFFPSDGHKTAVDALIYSIKQRKGFVVITGEVGSGKTTVVRMMMRKLDHQVKTALITNTHLSPKGILTLILQDLEVPFKDGPKEKLMIQLYDFLIRQMKEGHNVALIIDEAQNLTPACLEEVRMLSNLETEKAKLIQIILIGQPELRKKLELPELRQLKQRVTIQYHLEPLSKEDTRKYIFHRLNLAKANGQDFSKLFDDDALNLIYEHSAGVPRVINNLCDHALLNGFVAESKNITRLQAREAVDSVLKNN